MKNTVSIMKCEDYNRDKIISALQRSIDNIGGLDSYIKKGSKVFLKVNLLRWAEPDKAVTTHPDFVFGLAKILKDYGANVIIGDSPGAGIPYKEKTLKNVYNRCGLLKVAEDSGTELNYNTEFVPVSNPNGKLVKHFNIIKPIREVDSVISVAKGKTHGFMYITGAVKNMFGVIPGLEKPGYHSKLKNPNNFSQMLIDLCELVKPTLSFMDAITCMEGNGPGLGEPKQVGLILASANPHLLDKVFCDIVGVDSKTIPTIRDAIERGLINEDFEIKGEDITNVRIKDFKMPETIDTQDGFVDLKFIYRILKPYIFKDSFSVKPVVIKKNCEGCRICEKSCPEHAITMVNKIAVIDYKKCIRCYCCHEMCEYHGIELQRPLLYKLVSKIM